MLVDEMINMLEKHRGKRIFISTEDGYLEPSITAEKVEFVGMTHENPNPPKVGEKIVWIS